MRIVCLLKVVNPGWFENTISFTLVTDYIRYYGSFEALQTKAKGPISTPNKHNSAHHGPINVSFL